MFIQKTHNQTQLPDSCKYQAIVVSVSQYAQWVRLVTLNLQFMVRLNKHDT